MHASLRTFLDLLNRENEITTIKAQVATGSLLNEVRNLSSMVTAFLNFARPQPLQLEQVSVSDLIEDCAAELRLKLVVDVDQSLTVRADERIL